MRNRWIRCALSGRSIRTKCSTNSIERSTQGLETECVRFLQKYPILKRLIRFLEQDWERFFCTKNPVKLSHVSHPCSDNLPETTIELRHPPKPNPPIPFFRCEKCRDCAFQSLADLVSHSRESHELFEVAELFNRHKIYSCPKCEVQFRSAYHLGQHLKQQV